MTTAPRLPPELIAHAYSFLKAPPGSLTYPSPTAKTLDLPAPSGPANEHLRDYCTGCLVSRDLLPYLRRLLYRTIVLASARQVRLLARTLEGHDARGEAPERSFEQSPFNTGSLIHPDMLLALSPMKMPGAEPTTPSNVGLLPDSPSVSSASIKEAADEIARLVHHVCITHNDGILASGDRLSDTYAWAPSLRSLFTRASNLETLSLVSRPNGAAIEQLVHPRTSAALRRLTVQSLSYSAPALTQKPTDRLFHALTHLHLVQTVPGEALLRLLIHPATGGAPLQVLRLSRVYHDGLNRIEEAFETLDRLSASTSIISDSRLPVAPSVVLRGRSSNAARFQTSMHLLIRNLSAFPRLRLLLLELGELGALDPPSPPTRRFANMTGTPVGEQFVTSSSATVTGQLATLDFPSDVPLGVDEATRWDQEEERRRTANRDAYWLTVRQGREALREAIAAALRRDSASREQTGLEVRIVAPRPGGWNRFESQADFEAQLASVEEDREEQSSYNDPDVFELAEKRWDLGYAPVPDPSGGGDFSFSGRKPLLYWLGTLPRVKSADGVVTQGGAAMSAMQV